MNFKNPKLYGYIGFTLGILSSFTNSGKGLDIFSIIFGSIFDGAVLFFAAKVVVYFFSRSKVQGN